MTTLTPEEEKRLDELVSGELGQPPTIGVVGMSGVGKSSTVNRLFRTELAVSHTVACTKEFWEIRAKIKSASGPAMGKSVELRIFDAPGLGEDWRRDPYYLERYEESLPECDVILWLLAARNRAVALDQQYLLTLKHLSTRMVFGLSQVDLVDPLDWGPGLPIPSRQQERNIQQIIADRSARLSAVLERDIEVIPFSNSKGYNLEALFFAVISGCAERRKWIFQGMKGFSYEDFIPSGVSEVRRRRPHTAESHDDISKERDDWPTDLGCDHKNSHQSLIGEAFAYVGEKFSNLLPRQRLSSADREMIRDAIGRDDIDRVSPTPKEAERLQQHLASIRKRNLKP